MNNALNQSLDLLTNRLLQARAQQRRMKRNADKKRELLLNSGNVLEYELKDAFSMETMPQKKKIRILPPPGLFPLIKPLVDTSVTMKNDPNFLASTMQDNNNISSSITNKSKNEQECCLTSSSCFLIHSCTGWTRGTFQDRVWIRLIAENSSNTMPLHHVHLVLSPNSLLPKIIVRNTQSIVTPGQTVELYAAFTMTDDLFYSQLEHTLKVAIQYSIKKSQQKDDNEETTIATSLSDDCEIKWAISKSSNRLGDNNHNNTKEDTIDSDNNHKCNWIQTLISNPTKLDQALSIFYPSNARITLGIIHQDIQKICKLLDLQPCSIIAKEEQESNNLVFHSDNEDLMIVISPSIEPSSSSAHNNMDENNNRCFNVYGLTDRIVAQHVTQLIQHTTDLIQSIKYAPPKICSSNDLKNLIISLQDQMDYITTATMTSNDQQQQQQDYAGLVASRENTAILLTNLLEVNSSSGSGSGK
ncbi:hypothetical protein BDA99DRAFT_527124 [Phascolomyces articulosus]|uniref:Uncharacterized protein n=1 Tax=Phascolomyces articulosus TaxID=60185 RepID=A0AAD5JMV8_9FUNG|nr:hypothetical protein BDA99DRAFT_527124 [Phascolomyces articulosus]